MAKERFYDKLKSKVLSTYYFSSDLFEKAKGLKELEGEKFTKQVDSIADVLLEKMKMGDGVAYSLFKAAHEEKLSSISDLNDFTKIKQYITTHKDLQNDCDNLYFDPKVAYFANVLGSHSELWNADDGQV